MSITKSVLATLAIVLLASACISVDQPTPSEADIQFAIHETQTAEAIAKPTNTTEPTLTGGNCSRCGISGIGEFCNETELEAWAEEVRSIGREMALASEGELGDIAVIAKIERSSKIAYSAITDLSPPPCAETASKSLADFYWYMYKATAEYDDELSTEYMKKATEAMMLSKTEAISLGVSFTP